MEKGDAIGCLLCAIDTQCRDDVRIGRAIGGGSPCQEGHSEFVVAGIGRGMKEFLPVVVVDILAVVAGVKPRSTA